MTLPIFMERGEKSQSETSMEYFRNKMVPKSFVLARNKHLESLDEEFSILASS